MVAFLKRVMAAVPFNASVAGAFGEKIKELKAAAPILRSVTRREVVLYRLENLRRSIQEVSLQAATVGSSGGGGGGGGNSAGTASLAASRAAHLSKLQGEYSAQVAELERLNDGLQRDVSGYEALRNTPFIYKGQRLLDVLRNGSGAVSFSALGPGNLLPGGTTGTYSGGYSGGTPGARAASIAAASPRQQGAATLLHL
jgi:hypothetical protein